EVAYVIGDAAARVVFVGAEFVPVVEQLRAKLPSVERVVVVDGGGDGPDGYEAWLAQAGPGEPEHRPEPDDCFLQLYTSGTTGFPKGAMLTHRSLAAHNAAATHAPVPGALPRRLLPGLRYDGDVRRLLRARPGRPPRRRPPRAAPVRRPAGGRRRGAGRRPGHGQGPRPRRGGRILGPLRP